MGRMHAPGKGLSQSALPYRRSVPTWLKLTSDDVKEQIYKLAKKGLTPSQIGECWQSQLLLSCDLERQCV
ncbi:Rps13 [Phodopus roborovskii]|uniref:Rps13 protein n=1 Tax=Phodopus roborovskii TaxID=109678 RepID=A0AAU9ZK98_PHORO|nr:Rps13 [Phodopus roborovskii]